MAKFDLNMIGDTSKRNQLGDSIKIDMFRVVRGALVNLISMQIGDNVIASNAMYMTGKAMGLEMGEAFFSEIKDLNEYVEKVGAALKDFKVGLLRIVDNSNLDKGKLTVAVDECVSCSGTPNIGEPICHFEGGLVAGLLKYFLKKEVDAVETKCWGKGDETCEFEVTIT